MNVSKVLLTAAAAGFATALTVWATTTIQPNPENCPAPSARSVTSLFAPCLERQAYNEPATPVLRP
jgi:hypothetical protein